VNRYLDSCSSPNDTQNSERDVIIKSKPDLSFYLSFDITPHGSANKNIEELNKCNKMVLCSMLITCKKYKQYKCNFSVSGM